MTAEAAIPRGRPKTFWVTIGIAVAVTLAVLLLQAFIQPVLIERLEEELLDKHFRLRGAEKPNPNIVIVSSDEQTAAKLGRWPISHTYLAAAVDHLAQDGAKHR